MNYKLIYCVNNVCNVKWYENFFLNIVKGFIIMSMGLSEF